MKTIINGIFKNVSYWQDKNLLLKAIHPDYFMNKNVVLQLLGIGAGNVEPINEAKRGMWNYHITDGFLGDDILKLTHKSVLSNRDFIKSAILKYNRTYIYLPKELQASREFAMDSVLKEREYQENKPYTPILSYMPETFKLDHEIALIATTRNIESLKYATNLKKNKYFLVDIMNLLDNNKMKQKVLSYIDKDLLSDKRFVSKLGCFDNLCENFHSDLTYISNAVRYDINILRKTKLFDQAIIKSAMRNENSSREVILSEIFRYIEKFTDDYEELNNNIKNKDILGELFWEFGSLISEEFI
ncbi:MAG: DUF4116 domain-containing protein [Campylobacterota bacterium]|nr:DUF4116 domain-containing protein [Campylobacterota bacterium]